MAASRVHIGYQGFAPLFLAERPRHLADQRAHGNEALSRRQLQNRATEFLKEDNRRPRRQGTGDHQVGVVAQDFLGGAVVLR